MLISATQCVAALLIWTTTIPGSFMDRPGEDLSWPSNSSDNANDTNSTISFDYDSASYMVSATEIAPLPNTEHDSENHCVGCICPRYRVLDVKDSYEVRLYPSSSWASTTVLSKNRILAELQAREKLFNYVALDDSKFGKNLPFLTQLRLKDKLLSRKRVPEFAVSLFLTSETGVNLPIPNDGQVLIDGLESRIVYVRNFSAVLWRMSDAFLKSQVSKLLSDLRKEGEAFLADYYYLASYSKSIEKMSKNPEYYEIWLYATRKRSVLGPKDDLEPYPKSLKEVTEQTRLSVCRGFECPKFDVIGTYPMGIQKRRYFSSYMVTHQSDTNDFSKMGFWKAFMPLHLYRHGINSHFEMIESVRPAGVVRLNKSPHNWNATTYQYTVFVFLPERLSKNPPTSGPTSPLVKVNLLDELAVYVRSVGGFLLDPVRIKEEYELFTKLLDQCKLCYDHEDFYLAIYDSITRFHGRLNEIWLPVKVCQTGNS